MTGTTSGRLARARRDRTEAAVDLCVVIVSFLSAVVLSILVSRCVMGEDKVANFGRLVAGKAGFVHSLVVRFAVGELSEPQPPVEAYFLESLTMN